MTPIKPGYYWYKRPGWDKAIAVEVRNVGKQTFVHFHENCYPVRWKNIPADAQFTEKAA